MSKNADPDQLASSEAKEEADLDLHCLQMQGLSGFSRTRAKPGNAEPVLPCLGKQNRSRSVAF